MQVMYMHEELDLPWMPRTCPAFLGLYPYFFLC